LTSNQFGSQGGQAIVLAIRPPVFDRHVPALNVTGFGQSSVKCRYKLASRFQRRAAEKADHRHRRLLRARHERPRSCRAAAKQDDEIAPSYT
jgi:hypothetical protein